MSKERQDAWSKEDDLLLADTVLRHIREGSTQLKAFDEVGDRLNRTSAACGFRWNAIVREPYEQAIEIAKKQRKERRRMGALKPTIQKTVPNHSEQVDAASNARQGITSTLTLSEVITFLNELNQKRRSSDSLAQENKRLEGEAGRLQKENEELRKRLSILEKQHETVKEDYQSLIQIMDRARKMVILQDEEQKDLSAFRMDKNGNLEKIAK